MTADVTVRVPLRAIAALAEALGALRRDINDDPPPLLHAVVKAADAVIEGMGS